MSNWKKCSLGQVVTFASGSSFSEKYQGMKNEQYDFYKVSDMNTCENNKFMIKAENTISKETSNKIKAKIHPKNTVIFPKVGAALLTNKRRITTKDSIFDNNIMGLIATEEIDYLFLYYFMSSIDLGKYVQTGAIPSVNNTIIENIMVQLPPMVEQQKIAEILSSVDAAIEKTEQVIAKTEEVKKGLMQQLLTKGIGHTEFVDTELGSLPSKWTVMNFMSLVNILDFRGRTPKKLGLDWGGNIPALSANNVRMGYIDFSLPTHYGNDTLYEKWMTKGDLEIGDLVLTTEAPAGNIAIINKNERYILSQRVIGIKVYREYLLPEYLKYYFMSDLFNKYLKQFSTGTTVTGISQKSLAFLKIPLPSLQEQEKISSTLLQYDSKLLNDNQYLKELKNLKSGLMQQLLTGQVRVKVD